MSRNLVARLTVAAVAIPTILWLSYQGGWWLWGMVALFALVATLEFLWAEGFRPSQTLFWLSLSTVAAVLLFGLRIIPTDRMVDPTGRYANVVGISLLVFFCLSAVLIVCRRRPAADLFAKQSRLVWGICYLALLYPLVFLVGQHGLSDRPGWPSGGDSLLFLFAVLWVGDTAAMWIGSAFGKHQLAPTVSPNKTIEGFLGGMLGGLAVGVGMVFWKFSPVPWYQVLLIAAGCSFFGQLGDLVESMWKRSLGIKDASAIIPGHGGVLDRFDSLLFAAPYMWFCFQLIL